MSERNWSRYVAVGLTLLALAFVSLGFGYSSGELWGSIEKRDAQTCVYLARTEPEPSLNAEGIAAYSAENLTAGTSNRSYYDCEDLKAQRTMANWTQIMGVAAGLGVIISVIGIGLIFQTLRESQKAANAARVNAEAYIWNERAWLRFTHKSHSVESVFSASSSVFPSVSISNSGNSTAKVLAVTATPVDDGWKKIGPPIAWPVDGRRVEGDKSVVLRGMPIYMDLDDEVRFRVDLEYQIMGGDQEQISCRIGIRITKNGGSAASFDIVRFT